jgi:integrase
VQVKGKAPAGIRIRHSRGCASELGIPRARRSGAQRPCNCDPTIEAWVYSKRDDKKIRRTFSGKGAMAEAKGWRIDAAKGVKDKTLRAPSARTLREEAEEWLAGAEAGSILNKRSKPFKPAVLRGYRASLELRVLPALGDRRLTSLDFRDLLELQEELQGEGCSASVIRNSFVPLQSILRRARRRGAIAMNPAIDLELPSAASRDKAATPEQASEALAAFGQARELLRWADSAGKTHEPDYSRETAILATAFFAGLRRGEMRALRVGDVDLEARTIAVERGWDDKEGPIAPKSIAGARTVFLLDVLRPHLEQLMEDRAADELVFGGGSEEPFDARALTRKIERALAAIDKARTKEAEEAEEEPPAPLYRWRLHEARHSFSTWMDHAGISADRADRYMGHSSGGVAARYRHLLLAQREEDRAKLDAYVAGAASGKVRQLAAAG